MGAVYSIEECSRRKCFLHRGDPIDAGGIFCGIGFFRMEGLEE